MTTNPPADVEGHSVTDQSLTSDEAVLQTANDTIEAILRQLVALRATGTADDQLMRLIRMVDSATWSAPVPVTMLVDGSLVRGVLVPSEVSAAFLDDALRRFAHETVDELERDAASVEHDSEPDEGSYSLLLQQARAFLRRVMRRPFGTAQEHARRRNAEALMALGRLRRSGVSDMGISFYDVPGRFAESGSVARNVVPYATGPRALTLADVSLLVGGDWITFPTPIRVAIGHIGAWTLDLA